MEGVVGVLATVHRDDYCPGHGEGGCIGGLFTRDWAEAIYNMWLSSVCTDRYDPVPEFPCRQYVTRENCIHILYIHRTVTLYTPTLVHGSFYTLVLRGSGGCYHFYRSACCMLFTLDNPLQPLYRPACLTGCSNLTCVYHQTITLCV